MPVNMSPVSTKKGLSSTYLILVWSTFGGVILYAFHSNFLSMLISPIIEKPLDTAEDILERGLIPIMKGGGVYKNLLQKSSNKATKKLGENVLFTEEFQPTGLIFEKVLSEKTHAWITSYITCSDTLPYENFHISRDTIDGTNPWFVWIMNKKWSHKESLERHILYFQQVHICRNLD